MNKICKKLIISSFILLFGCAQQYGPNSYKQSVNDSGIIVPAPLTSKNISHFYDLPAQKHPIITPSLSEDL
jgi:hypothetical protein